MKIKSIKTVYLQAILFLLIVGTNSANAQLTEYEAMYFQNQYINNPAMAGLEEGAKLNLGYQRQWDEVPGNPILMNATFEYNSGNRTGLGLNVTSDRAGLINRTRIMGTYAYHLPIGAEEKLHFGISAGAKFASIDYGKVIGDKDDAVLQNFNEGVKLDGDLGIAYTDRLLTVQASVPKLHNLFYENDNGVQNYADRSTFYSAVSYKILLSNYDENLNIEPLVAYRGIKGHKDILDMGGRFNFPDYKMNISAFYHTNKTVSTAFGISVDDLGIFLAYSKYFGSLGAYANNTFEVGLNYKIK
ncbi:PorP/SprF family type IX secretion system membrane protein [Flavobacterium sp. N1736]|uniref:PorP/SprF family type IX secretion system membrane protein n=1 Tax=Flavobacterium sp. N1736 TaxID=2986823 RepID=UPI002225751B|nr:PorP/SprF family type IX secretion system membrane protein [Flavobacterium sp. N1736]